MQSKLILVSGLSGAGKTTLIAGALKAMPDLEYIRTYTTRPMRPGEENSHEYIFVSQAEYDNLRAGLENWDHTEYAGFSYGADAAVIKTLLAEGKNVICSVAPDLEVIDDMAKLYGPEPVTIWIRVPKEVAKSRIYNDDIRDSRNEDVVISTNFDYVLEPVGEIDTDVTRFVGLIRDLMK
jgi:guanylate kinase